MGLGIFNLLSKPKAAVNDNAQETLEQLLLRATLLGETADVKDCLAQGADINARDTHGNTPLMIAVREGWSEIIPVLLEQQADATLHNNQDKNVLHMACREKAAQDFLPQLIAAAAPVCDKQDMHQATPAFYAAQTNNLPAILLLKEAKADFTLRNKDNISPALWATQLSHTAVVSCLLDSGVSPNEIDARGMTGLMHAANLGNKEMVALYLSHNANAERRAQDGRRAQDFALARGEKDIASLIDADIARRYDSIYKGSGAKIVPMKRLQLRPKKDVMS